MSKSKKLNIKNSFITLFLGALLVSFLSMSITYINLVSNQENSFKNQVIQTKREEARITLKHLSEVLNADVKEGLTNINDDISLNKWAVKNLIGVLNGGPTSDGFMIKIVYNEIEGEYELYFIEDGSPDCAKPEFLLYKRTNYDEVIIQKSAKEYLEKHYPELKLHEKNIIKYSDIKEYPEMIAKLQDEGIIMHKDPEQAEKALYEILQGRDSVKNQNVTWLFDNSPELLEFIGYPPGSLGINNEPRTIAGTNNKNYTKIMIVLGTQTDEVLAPYNDQINNYKEIRSGILKIDIFLIVISLFFMTHLLIDSFHKKLSHKK